MFTEKEIIVVNALASEEIEDIREIAKSIGGDKVHLLAKYQKTLRGITKKMQSFSMIGWHE